MGSDKQSVCDLVHLLAQHGVRHVVLSPGSRNAPFSLSFENDTRFKTHVVIDERSAGYIALGMAQRLNEPVALCCTSGTAAMNYGPALAEAHFQGVPLVAITCDRPLEWIGQGDGQTIYQKQVYGRHVTASLSVEDLPTTDNERAAVWKHIDATLAHTRQNAPVHFNVHLQEPLYTTSGPVRAALAPTKTSVESPSGVTLDPELSATCAKAKSVLILATGLPKSDRLQAALKRLALQPNTLVLTEHTANLADPLFCGTIDRLLLGLSDEGLAHFIPEVLITLGNNIVSKKIKALLRERQPAQHWHVDVRRPNMDTFACLSRSFAIHPEDFVSGLEWTGSGDYSTRIRNWQALGQTQHNNHTQNADYGDLWTLQQVHRSIPGGSFLQMGNSSIVRYFLLDDPRADLFYNGNRGTSGIDGCTSTAIGANVMGDSQTWLVSGDVAFFYDANAWWNSLDKQGLKVVLVNNGGGGIFRIIPGPESTGLLERNFESHHGRTAEHLAREHQLAYQTAETKNTVKAGLDWLKMQDGPALLEVFTPRTENAALLHTYFETLKPQTT